MTPLVIRVLADVAESAELYLGVSLLLLAQDLLLLLSVSLFKDGLLKQLLHGLDLFDFRARLTKKGLVLIFFTDQLGDDSLEYGGRLLNFPRIL